MPLAGRRIAIQGTVQGVGFRPWIYRLATEEGLRGSVRNDARGVVIDAYGSEAALTAFVGRIGEERPAAARLAAVVMEPIPPDAAAREFVIEDSDAAGPRRVAVPPDLATCEACVAEVLDPADRRHRYPFTNCTGCGPRHTILRDVPYDRPATTMAAFTMCDDCRREYDDPRDRRFHAQPNACPACGPRYELRDAEGRRLEAVDPIAAAAAAIGWGAIVAMKGIGGFHLACDAAQDEAVARLRARKRRAEKPFAVMARSLDEAERLAVLDDAERALLTGPERPIVLVRRRPGAPLAPSVAPGSPLLGLLLPYSPAHHLLLADAGGPLVMTSGNLAEEPLAYRDEDALARLRGVADLFLVHDRAIETPSDDSVARVIAGAPAVLRRSRGWVPRPVLVPRPFARVVLACGAQLKNTFAVGVGDAIYAGPHVGDLDDVSTADAFARGVEGLLRLLGVQPEVVAHDLHPGYVSTAWALRQPAGVKVGVQHHHAHMASAMAEHGLEGPVIALAYDGTGYGTDGAAWGGEALFGDAAGFERMATFRPIRLPGGDVAVRQVWRLAAALLDDAYDGAPPLDRLELFRSLRPADVEAVRRLARVDALAPRAHGVGRYFDALGALGLCRTASTYEGQVALAWNLAADPRETGRYPFALEGGTAPWVVDTRPMVRAAVDDLLAGAGAAAVSARFHNTLVAASAAIVEGVTAERGPAPVVLSGGCFANALLAERLRDALAPAHDVRLHREVPAGDGGIAVGQALVADAVTRDGRRIPCA